MLPKYIIRDVTNERIYGYSHHIDAAHAIAVGLSTIRLETFRIEFEGPGHIVATYFNGSRVSK